MPVNHFDDKNSDVTVLEALMKNSENLKKVMDTVSNIGDVVGDKYEANTTKIIEKIENLQVSITKLANSIQQSKSPVPERPEGATSLPKLQGVNVSDTELKSQLSAIMTCNTWEDLQALASQPSMVAFTLREADKRFEVDATKGNQIFVYVGEMPKLDELFKTWISSQLTVAKEKVFQGTIKT